MASGKTVYQDGVRVVVAKSWTPPQPGDDDAAKPKAKRSARGRSRTTPADADPRTPDAATS
jgi:hypothetical protein